MHDMPGMPSLAPWGSHTFWTTWDLQWGWLVAGVLLLAGYLAAVQAARRGGQPARLPRVLSFITGVIILEVTLASSINAYAMSIFWVHMIEHLILIMVVPAFLVFGHPLGTVADALGAPARQRYLAVLRSGPVSLLLHPLVGLGIYSVVIVGTHLTGFMDQMAQHSWLMTGEQIVYVVAGYLLLLCILGDEPIRWQLPYLMRLGLVLLAMVPDTVVGIVLMQTQRDPFPVMMGMHPSWAPDPVHDVQIGGALMWAAGDGLMMCFGFALIVAVISAKDRRAQMIGPWLESARRNTQLDRFAQSGAIPESSEELDPDGEDALAAYNTMLSRLNEHP